MKTSTCNARRLVESKTDFQGNNTFGRKEGKMYVVYSYGYHFPMYIFKAGRWYRNTDKYSVTTSKHQSQLRPDVEKFVERNTRQLRNMI